MNKGPFDELFFVWALNLMGELIEQVSTVSLGNKLMLCREIPAFEPKGRIYKIFIPLPMVY